MKRPTISFFLSLSIALAPSLAFAQDAGNGAGEGALDASAGGSDAIPPGDDAGDVDAGKGGKGGAAGGQGGGAPVDIKPHDYDLLEDDGGTACSVSSVGHPGTSAAWLFAVGGTLVALRRRRERGGRR